jgi:uroporphyrinogen-III synthase/uroporphyrinogen III methyltransferase/synthase
MEQGDELVRALEGRGARALAAPTIELLPADDEELARAVVGLSEGRFEWLMVTSQAGVRALVDAGMEAVEAKVAAVGAGTAGALRGQGIEPDLVPGTYTTEALGRAMPPGSGEVLVARADIASNDLEDVLAAKGWIPVRLDAYLTVTASELPAEVRRTLAGGGVDAVTFTSASTVRGFVELAGVVRGPKLVCIGPVTAAEAWSAGLAVDSVADPHTIEGLVAALERVLGPTGPSG